MKCEIIRVEKTVLHTFGVFLIRGEVFMVTLEPPWKGNKPKKSCIPDDVYLCKRVDSPKYGDTFEITEVPGRTHILFHWGNFVKDTKGCVLTGQAFGSIRGVRAVVESKKAHSRFMAAMSGVDSFILSVRSV